jgi:ubiquinone/menaquinone biosynthesis C-methylase UbiE
MSPLLPQSRPQPDDEEHPQRLALLPAAGVLGALALKPGQRFLDVDAGVGAYFFPVFEAMRGKGVFLAAHLDEERLRRFLTRLEGYSAHPGYSKVEVVRSKPDRLPLPEASADRVLLQQAFHRLRDQQGWLGELRRVLAPGGLLCLLDWKPSSTGSDQAQEGELGPADALRVPEAQAAHALQEAGFSLVVSHAGFQQHWCLTARR